MKILIYGAGVIGCTYGWQLSKTGEDITVLVRKEKKQIEENGISIHCTDYRGGQKKTEEIVFHPKVIDELSPQNDFEYIIISTNSPMKEVLPVLGKSAGKAHILFFQNIWDNFNEIDNYLSSDQYFFGFPFMAGGGRNTKRLDCIIAGSKYSKTMLGEKDGSITPRLQKIANAMQRADMKPFISEQIITWLVPHYAFIAGISAGVLKAGGTMNAFINKPQIIREAIKAVREGFQICTAKGIDPKKEKVNQLYYFPLFITTPIVRKIFNEESMSLMFDGYLKNSVNEIENMLQHIIESGEKNNIEMPYLKNLQQSIIGK